ncbi:MAG: DUF4126 family protein [Edaphobacter sp.]|uniref:DUF4126 family protein n=1 Tax=Edaphobacter sp. TaxID=1934404 RepID=UPI00239548C1|nr:DUF4126 family protein [Edaphobacter sp.]MDE1178692.1 DUF4126 family protein [Edaphobacter sp.]
MTMEVMTWLIAIPLLGFITGMRTMTPMAVLCWFAWLKLLPVGGSWAWWCASLPVVIAFTVLAIAEYAADKLGMSPRPTRPVVLLIRFFFGGLVGAILASGLDASGVEGATLAILGALVGAFAAYQLRHQLTRRIGCKAWQVTLTEDVFAVSFAILCMGIVTG